jgi:hypothetical protein
MNSRLPWDITDNDADDEKAAAAAAARVVRRLIVVLLLIAAALDLTRCGLVMTAARHPAPTAGLVAAGLAAAGLTARTARGCQVGRRWAGWSAFSNRRSVSPASGRVRLPQPLYDPRHSHRGRRVAAGHHHPGHCRPDRPPGHDTAIPSVLDREATRCSAGPHTMMVRGLDSGVYDRLSGSWWNETSLRLSAAG